MKKLILSLLSVAALYICHAHMNASQPAATRVSNDNDFRLLMLLTNTAGATSEQAPTAYRLPNITFDISRIANHTSLQAAHTEHQKFFNLHGN